MYSFEPKKTPHVQSHVRRILDLTVPNWSPDLERDRAEDRTIRVIPALLCAWERDAPVVDQHAFVLTRDFSSEGVGVILNSPFRDRELLLGFRLGEEVMHEPWFFLGTAQHLRRFGGGYWTMGVQLREFVGATPVKRCAALGTLMERLLITEPVAAT